MWIVMTAKQKMPSSCISSYTKIALVKLSQEYTAKDMRPKMISERARGILEIHSMGYYPSAGRTMKSGLQQTLAAARDRAQQLNNANPSAEGEMLMSWGGSA